MGRTAVIVQARTDSTRLPGKVLMDLGGRPVLEHVLRRCARIPGVDVVCCATTSRPMDDAIVAVASRLEAQVYRGPVADVLARYAGAARSLGAAIVLRVTSDCPLIDPLVCGDVIRLRRESGADYACNNMPPTWPHGLDCEAFTVQALYAAESSAVQAADREHVTPWIRRNEALRRVNLAKPEASESDRRWVLDYPEDLAFMRAVFDYPSADRAGWRELLALMERHPELTALNASRNQRPASSAPPPSR